MSVRVLCGIVAFIASALGSAHGAQAAASLVIAPSTLAFGSQRTGTSSAPVTVALTNVGAQAVTVLGVSSNSAQFVVTSACGSIAAGATCSFTVVFSPTAVGDLTATITIASNGAGSPQALTATGTGTGSTVGPPPDTPPVTPPPLEPPPTIDLVEYYHADWDNYFITGIPDEIAKLDRGVFAGWARTGLGFKAYAGGAPAGAAVCRFWSGDSFAPRSTHFLTPYPNECGEVEANPLWIYEGNVFQIDAPGGNGTCPSGRLPVYRLYNDGHGGAPNHRYTIDAAIRNEMVAQGWISEGYGPLGVNMCAPE